MSSEEFDRRQPVQDDRSGDDRRRNPEGRRAEDRQQHQRLRDITATVLALCGALSVVYIFFAAVGAVDLGDAVVASGVAIVLAAIWLLGAWQRARSGAAFATRPDRERRGF
jgi:protein-S-isoprenylcysteine O-methyltransferase Ste14